MVKILTIILSKTQPKKNADWFCEKCQEGNEGKEGQAAKPEGAKTPAWQTPAQRKAYTGPPSVNTAKSKVK